MKNVVFFFNFYSGKFFGHFFEALSYWALFLVDFYQSSLKSVPHIRQKKKATNKKATKLFPRKKSDQKKFIWSLFGHEILHWFLFT